MARKAKATDWPRVEIAGVRYAIVPEAELDRLLGAAELNGEATAQSPPLTPLSIDGRTLARRLVERRQRVGLSQAELARRAGVRVETLNRIERGKTNPDFTTIRKLVHALGRAERTA